MLPTIPETIGLIMKGNSPVNPFVSKVSKR
ncbi:MAG: hypothetical protein BWY86_01424 [Candidatus Aminicenantes bacterium ADurb.Bin508]|nr:MAG: hypothetical protein BWY86_01424 [Candidatus Aminicenantes bacterium ADurb.Bin508]